jgi:hypothetical protein
VAAPVARRARANPRIEGKRAVAPGERRAQAGARRFPSAARDGPGSLAAGARRANAVTAFRVTEGILMKFARILAASAAVALSFAAPAAFGQAASYTPGSVWTFTYVQIEPGQFENYLDFLDKEFKRGNDYGIRQGYILSYHVLQVNNPRNGEPDLVLAVEAKDYLSNAQQLEIQKKYEEFMAKDNRKMENESGERKAMRKFVGGMELQELKLK